MDSSKEQPKTTAGLDLGDRYSYLCLIDQQSGEIVEEGRLRTSPEAFRRRFASERPPMRIAIETGTHSPWVSRLLEECGHEVLVANARKLRLIYANKRKTDEVDAENLARLARLDPKLLYPLKHRGEACQAHSQSAKTTAVGGEQRGYDGNKKIRGRKRHLLVDTEGLVLKAKVHSAKVPDQDGLRLLLRSARGGLSRLSHLWLDAGYEGRGRRWAEEEMALSVEMVRKPPRPVPEEVAMIRLMVRRLARA